MRWSAEFVAACGPDSELPRALSDYYTIKLANMMAIRGDLKPGTKVALYSSKEAVAEVERLAQTHKEIGAALFREAFGTVPVGTINKSVDDHAGIGTFEQWLEAFERGFYRKCEALVSTKH